MSDTRFVNQRAVGSPVMPDEAIPLVEGDGRFLNDIKLPGMYHVAFLRSQHAHARLRSVDTSKARELPGVIKVLTGKELLGKVDPFRSMPNRFSGGEFDPALARRRQGAVLRRGDLRGRRRGSRHRRRCRANSSRSTTTHCRR